MELCRIASLLNLCVASYGVNIQAKPNVRLGGGYDFSAAGMDVPTAFEPILDCEPSSVNIACRDTMDSTDSTDYSRTVKTKSDYNYLVSDVSTAEGSGWGVSASAGVTAIKDSKTTNSSWTYFLGSGIHMTKKSVTNSGKLVLSEPAKNVLKKNASHFLESYGRHYISDIIYGGSFMGSITLTEKDQSQTSDLKFFAEVDVKELFYSAKASTAFENKIEEHKSTIEKWTQVKYSGGGVVDFTTNTPQELGEMFGVWKSNIKAKKGLKPLLVFLRPYLDSEEVQEVVYNQSPEVQTAFKTTITQTTMDQFSTDYGNLLLVIASIEQAYEWTSTKLCGELKEELESLEKSCNSYKNLFEQSTEAGILARQSEMLKGIYSWFRADSLYDKFEEIKKKLPSPAPTRPEVVSNLGRMPTITCPLGKELTSCSMKMTIQGKAEPYWSVYPIGQDSCRCYDEGDKTGEAECVASCVDKSELTEVQNKERKSQSRFTVSCEDGYMVTGCGIRQNIVKSNPPEHYSYYYPNSESSCECYNNRQNVDCFATCRKNVDRYQIVHKKEKGTWDVTCPDGKSALGCGFKIEDPGHGAEAWPSSWQEDWKTCRCYNSHGMTCYAICGDIKSDPSCLVNANATIVTTDMLI